MVKYLSLLIFIASCILAGPPSRAEQPRERPGERSISEKLDHSLDADGMLWGVEIGDPGQQNNKNAVNNTLKTKYVKYRLRDASFTDDGESFISSGCLPNLNQCFAKIDLDSIVSTFKSNGWSMIPMFSHGAPVPAMTTTDIDHYVNFVDWFVSKYKNDADIKYIELNNDPLRWWNGGKEQLLDANNKIYDRIKAKYPDIKMGTPGFEYWLDDADDQGTQWIAAMVDYFLDAKNNAKFDFWAFHGYPTAAGGAKAFYFYPPTKTAVSNKYAGIPGISEIRQKMDANGWQNRLIIDTEHVNAVHQLTAGISSQEDKLVSAYTIQELVLKKTLKYKNKFVLDGILPLKIRSRGSQAENRFGSLNSDGSLTQTVEAVGLFWSKLNEYNYSSRISGEFDNEHKVWVEKFISGNKELYIFFKPFKYQIGLPLQLDNEILNYTLSLGKKPSKVTVTDINGNTSDTAPDSVLTLKAVNSPQFLEVEY